MKFGLTDETIHKINSVFKKYGEVDEVIIYGSRAKGNYREGSDIDITLKGKALTESIKSKIYSDIDDLNTPYLYDISVLENIKADDLVEHINRVGQLFYKRINSQS